MTTYLTTEQVEALALKHGTQEYFTSNKNTQEIHTAFLWK